MISPIRRYFVADDAEAMEVNTAVIKSYTDHRDRLIAFFASYGATLGITNDGWPKSVFLQKGAAVPDGLRSDGEHSHKDQLYTSFVPFGSTRAARAFKTKAKAVGSFHPSDIIIKHYDADAMIWAGGCMWVSTGHTARAGSPIAVQVPEDADHPYTPHPSFREIKKSEYIAITEET